MRFTALHGAVAGAVLGAVFGAWTAASRAPGYRVTVATAAPPPVDACPEGYSRVNGLDPSAAVEGTNVRWLARCDPRVSGFAVSESLELLWTNEIYLDGRAQLDSLRELLTAVGRSGALLLEPLGEPREGVVAGVRAPHIDVDAAYRVPPLAVRVWLLPVGPSTLQVTLVAPRARLEPAAAAARGAIDAIEGLAPYAPAPAASGDGGATPSAALPAAADRAPPRAFTVRNARCPAGYTDATPAQGGAAPSMYVGRYCLAPDEQGGVELTFAQVTARGDSPDAAAQLLRLAAESARAVGVETGAGFGPPEPVALRGGVAGQTALMNVDPPPARVRLRGYVAAAGDGTVYALATSVPDHAAAAASALERWMADAARVRQADAAALRSYRLDRALKTIVLPSAITAVLGAMITAALKRRGPGEPASE